MSTDSIAQNEPNDYQVFKSSDGIELVINMRTGEAFATQAGYVRMSGKAKSTISERLQGVQAQGIKTTKIQTDGGLQGVRLIPADTVFDWLLDDNRELAKAMGTCGATVYLHQLAGYKIQTIAPIAPPPAPLPPVDMRLDSLVGNLKFLDVDVSNPRFKQGLQDLALNILGVTQPQLPGTGDRWLGVAEKAEEMGYSVSLVTRYRSALGLWVSKHIELQGLERKKEKRLCGGTQREIFLYRDGEALEELIKEYMDAKVLKS